MKTTIKERMEIIHHLDRMGIDYHDAQALRRISMTLRRWFELECGNDDGCIERDEVTGKPRFYNARAQYLQANDPRCYSAIPDREAGALKRLKAIMAKYPELVPYVQGDCRGPSLYILRKTDLRDGESIDSVYNRGVAVY